MARAVMVATNSMSRALAALAAFLIALLFALAPALTGRAVAWGATPVTDPTIATNDELDRTTPRRTLEGFLHEGREGDFRVSASYLDLRALPLAARDDQGPELARKLAFVLERQTTMSLAKVPDDPQGDPEAKPPDTFVADTLYAGEEPVQIALRKVHFADGVDRWLISDKTVAMIPTIDAVYGPRSIGIKLPLWLTRTTFLGNEPWQWSGLVLAAFVAYIVARSLAAVVVRVASYFTKRTETRVDDALVESSRRPFRSIIGALAYRGLIGPLQLTTGVVSACEHVTYTVLTLGVTWLLLRGLAVSTMVLDEQASRDSYDAVKGRQVRTQALLLQRVASITIGFFSGAIVLLQFEFVRSVGVSLLASAGVLGVVAGFAAQKSLAAIIGGIQFSAAQPVRMGDQVIVEGQFGEIEEINLTFVVIRLWDKKRMVVPITYFLEKPIQNWTRTTTDLVGTVSLPVPQSVSVDAVRAELRRICEADRLWDKKTCEVQVTAADATTMTLRALVSSEDAPRLWELRCRVRERLVGFIHALATPAPATSPGAGPPPAAPAAPLAPTAGPTPDAVGEGSETESLQAR